MQRMRENIQIIRRPPVRLGRSDSNLVRAQRNHGFAGAKGHLIGNWTTREGHRMVGTLFDRSPYAPGTGLCEAFTEKLQIDDNPSLKKIANWIAFL